LAIDDSNIVISKTKSVVIVIRHLSEEDIELPEKLYSDNMSDNDNRHWELQYVVVTEMGSVAKRWKGRCYVSHGGQQLLPSMVEVGKRHGRTSEIEF
jgi:hypothetical protein